MICPRCGTNLLTNGCPNCDTAAGVTVDPGNTGGGYANQSRRIATESAKDAALRAAAEWVQKCPHFTEPGGAGGIACLFCPRGPEGIRDGGQLCHAVRSLCATGWTP